MVTDFCLYALFDDFIKQRRGQEPELKSSRNWKDSLTVASKSGPCGTDRSKQLISTPSHRQSLKMTLLTPLRNLISQLSVIFAPVLDYRKRLISAKVGSTNCEKIGRDMAAPPKLLFFQQKKIMNYQNFNFQVSYVTFGFRVALDQHRWRSDNDVG